VFNSKPCAVRLEPCALILALYYPYFIAYMAIGFVLSVLVFIWALRNGQFKDQKRARFLPLDAEPPVQRSRSTKYSRIEVYVLFGLICAGLLVSGAFVVVVLMRSG
jgi:cbb3-type cytochrome oxidase maturation protein